MPFSYLPYQSTFMNFSPVSFLYKRGNLCYQNLQEKLLRGMEFVQTKGSDPAKNAHSFFAKPMKLIWKR